MRIAISTAVVLLLCLPCSAKLKVDIKIDGGNDRMRAELLEGMKARINSTDRYAISTSAVEINLLIGVTCVVFDDGALAACDSNVTYFPYPYSGLSTNLETAGSLVSSVTSDVSYIANALVNHFINGTTDAALVESKEFFRSSLRSLCASKPAECK